MKSRILITAVLILLIPLGITNPAFGFDQGDVDIHGFVSQGYLKSSDNNYLGNSKDGSFQFNEIGINFSALLTDELRFGAQFFSRDLGDNGNNELIVDWAFLDYAYQDWLGVRAGKIKTPYGLYNRKRNADMLRTSILMPQNVYHEGVRDLVNVYYGMSLYGNVNLKAIGFLDYELYGGTVDIPRGTPYVRENLLLMEYTNPAIFNYIINNMGADPDTLEVVFRHIEGGALTWNTPLSGLRLRVTDVMGKGSYGLGSQTAELSMDHFGVASVEYDLSNITFAAEYMRVDVKVDVEVAGLGSMTSKQILEGYYGAISWDLLKWITVGGSYGEYYPDAEDKDGDDIKNFIPDYWAWQKDITLSVRFNVNEYFCIKLETHFLDGVGLLDLENNRPPDEAEQNWILYAVKSSLNF